MSPSIAQSIRTVSANVEVATRDREFVTLARVWLAAQSGTERASDIARNWRVGPRIESIVERNGVGVTAGARAGDWGSEVGAEYQRLATAFAQSLRNYGAFDAMLAGGFVVVPTRTRLGITTTGASGGTVAEASAKSITSMTLADLGVLEPSKSHCIVVVTDEVVQSPGAADVLGNELRGGLAVATDSAFLAIATAAGLASQATAGATLANVLVDIAYLLTNVTTSARSKLFIVTTPLLCKKLSMMAGTSSRAFPDLNPLGGFISGIPVLISDAVAAGDVLLVDASGFAANSDTIVLDASRQATLMMETVPDSPPTASTVVTSLWHQNKRALRAERWWAAKRLRDNCVARITGAAY